MLLMESIVFEEKPSSNILLWLNCMKRYIAVGQMDFAFKVQIVGTYFEPYIAQY
jgi:hypothetical protein